MVTGNDVDVDDDVDIVYYFAGSGIYGCREFES
jgi:hypothetical protein